MPGKVIKLDAVQGLTNDEVSLLQKQYGKNAFKAGKEHRLLRIMWDVFREPMFIMLVIACSLYFILGEIGEGVMMAVAMAIVTAISVYQEVKSSRALESLKNLVEPKVTVIREGNEQSIGNGDLVPGDVMLIEEGMKIPADAIVLQSNDLSLDESIVTGESMPVEKTERNLLFQGTTVNSGQCIAKVTATGNATVLGKIGKAVIGYAAPKTLLQLQINKFVRKLALFGLVAFFMILGVNYLHYHEFVTSLLFALTLAMSAAPEEIPVAFSSFMALGAYKMSRLGIISRQPQIIENLGAITVLCLDKTGTITENKMEVKTIYDYKTDRLIDIDSNDEQKAPALLYAVLASESNPFDAMEKAIWDAYYRNHGEAHHAYEMIYEYPLEGRPPMMTHVYQLENKTVAAAKGGAERILTVCKIDQITSKKIFTIIQNLAAKGYRVLGIASATHSEIAMPDKQNDFNWQFEGLVALHDPPKKNVRNVLKRIHDAKVTVKLLTGDYAETATNIASQIGLLNPLEYYTGNEIMNMSDDKLQQTVKSINVFTRMFPEAKLKVINALKVNEEIVAMTGDGINDAPALKSANIGIAMGKKGTETARQASDLILTDDNLEKIVTAISEGRKIYGNLIKAVRYIISIHIPIILTAALPVILGWTYPNIFTPIHIIFMELIMGPTCSIFFEKEPVETNIMLVAPRNRKAGIFAVDELLISITLGLTITAGVLCLYYIFMNNHNSIEKTRTVVFTTLILSNVLLTFTSRSFTKTMYHTSKYKNNLVPVILIASSAFLSLLLFFPPVRNLFQLTSISPVEFLVCLGTALASVMWFEVYKMDLWKIVK